MFLQNRKVTMIDRLRFLKLYNILLKSNVLLHVPRYMQDKQAVPKWCNMRSKE